MINKFKLVRTKDHSININIMNTIVKDTIIQV